MKQLLETLRSYLRSREDVLPPNLAWEAIDEGAFVLDCRTEKECSAGVLPGAVIVPHAEIGSSLSKIPQDKETVIVAYCAVGGRSGLVKDYLESIGYRNVFNGGGYDDLMGYRDQSE